MRDLVRTLAACFRRNDVLTYSSAISFQLLVSLLPLVALFLILLGRLGREDVWRDQVAGVLRERLRDTSFLAVDEYAERIFATPQLGWLALAAVLLLWTVSGAVRAVIGALNRIYEAGEDRPLVRRYWLSFLLAAAVGGLLLLALSVVAFGSGLFGSVGGPFDRFLRWCVAVVPIWLTVLLLLRFAPARPRPVRWLSLGSGLVIVAWVGASLLYGLYARHVADFESALGIMVAGLVLTGYVHVSAMVFLVGAQLDELIYEAEARPARGRRRRSPRAVRGARGAA